MCVCAVRVVLCVCCVCAVLCVSVVCWKCVYVMCVCVLSVL